MAYVNRSDIYKLFDESNGVIRLHVVDVDMLPIADVVEVKHGEWIECSNELNKYCSVCKKVHGTIYEKPPFCENCGAKMDGGKTND